MLLASSAIFVCCCDLWQWFCYCYFQKFARDSCQFCLALEWINVWLYNFYVKPVIFQVLLASIKVVAFWDVLPYSLINGHWCSGGTCCLHDQGRRVLSQKTTIIRQSQFVMYVELKGNVIMLIQFILWTSCLAGLN